MKKKFKHIEILDNGIVHYDSGLNQFTQEEADRLNEEYYANEASFIQEILADGHVEFPILYDNGPEPIWRLCYLPEKFEPSI